MKEHVELEKAIVEKIDLDILITKYRPNASINEVDAEKIDNAHIDMSQGNEMFIVADITASQAQIKKSAEEYFIHKGKMIPYTKAIAIVTNHKSSIIEKLFSGNSKTLYPTKEFSSLDEAQKWFDSLRI